MVVVKLFQCLTILAACSAHEDSDVMLQVTKLAVPDGAALAQTNSATPTCSWSKVETGQFVMSALADYMKSPEFCWRPKKGMMCKERSIKGFKTRGTQEPRYPCYEFWDCPDNWQDTGSKKCKMDCHGANQFTCGPLACSRNKESCSRAIVDMTLAVLSAIADTVEIIFPEGEMVKAIEMEARDVKNLRRAAKAGYKTARRKMEYLLSTPEEQGIIFKTARTMAHGKKLEKIQGKFKACKMLKSVMLDFLSATGEAFNAKNEEDMDKFNFDFFDPTGIATAIHADAGAPSTSAWLDMAGKWDPSGWLSAASTFVKPKCGIPAKSPWWEYKKKQETKVDLRVKRKCVKKPGEEKGCNQPKRKGKCPSNAVCI